MDANGNRIPERPFFGRTVIQSCCKLDYDTAQRFIDAAKEKNQKLVQEIGNTKKIYGGFSAEQLAMDLFLLNSLAVKRRADRYAHGSISLSVCMKTHFLCACAVCSIFFSFCLSFFFYFSVCSVLVDSVFSALCFSFLSLPPFLLPLQHIRLSFKLGEDKLPLGFYQYPIKDSNRLVEEYMLLANMVCLPIYLSVFVSLCAFFAFCSCYSFLSDCPSSSHLVSVRR